MAVDDRMTSVALTRAKTHVYNVTLTGHDVTLLKPGTKDELGHLLTYDELDLHAFPVREKSSDDKLLPNVGWAKEASIIFYVSKKELDDNDLTIDHINQYIKIRYKNKEHEISYRELYGSFGTDYLYVLIGTKV